MKIKNKISWRIANNAIHVAFTCDLVRVSRIKNSYIFVAHSQERCLNASLVILVEEMTNHHISLFFIF